jgi:outer membrane protein assembly factor BamE (lipoprotein component of BamABCDE complex)
MSNRIFLTATAALFLTACAGLSASGYAPTLYTSIHTAAFTNLKPGTSTKEDVRKQVGVPLTESHFPRLNEDVWQYRYLDGTTIVMLADVHFNQNGVLTYYEQRLDPAFTGGVDSM